VKHVTRLLQATWGLCAWAVFLLCGFVALILVTIVPGGGNRERIVTAASRAVFVLTGIRVRVTGREHLPDGHSVVVANHASYVDGPLLNGYLPSRFSFVIKGEMRSIPIIHFLLRRGGSQFVERFTAAGSARDARKIVKAARDGQSLAFFPEGTFTAEPGVARFRPGAFVAATRGGMAVVPVAIRGTRQMLPAGRILPRPCRIEIEILPPIGADDPLFTDHRALAEAARERVAAAVGEDRSEPAAEG